MIRYFFYSFLMISFSCPNVCLAEYRVFELEIITYAENTNLDQPANTDNKNQEELDKKTVLSNLDPQQYRGYNTILPNQKIRYISTWKCPGRTANKDYCPNPKVKTDELASSTPLETK